MEPAHLVSIDPADDPAIAQLDPFEASMEDGDDRGPRPPGELGEIVAFTSGTTGEPKAVRLPMVTLVASAVGSALRLGVASDDRWLVPIPTYHVGGLSPIVRSTLAGTTAVLQRSFEPRGTIEAIEAHDVTCVSLVPTQLSRLLDAGWEPPETLRFVLVGGGPIGPDLVERCGERTVPICPTYGTTETASQVATARPSEAVDNPGTVGRSLAISEVTIVDDGATCDAGETGEIVVDGPIVTPGYLEAGRPAAAFDDRGFHTGDLGYVDDEGRLWIEGRLDDRIVTGGEVVSAKDVADAIRSLEGVRDVAVVGIADDEWGERVGALVESEAALAVESIREACADQLPNYAVPKTIAITKDLPRTPSGTPNRTLVREKLR